MHTDHRLTAETTIAANMLELHSQSLGFDFRRAALWLWLERHIPLKSRVLDAGCGTGYMVRQLAQRGNDTVAIESEPNLVKFAQSVIDSRSASVRVIQMGIGFGAIASLGQFDRILCLDVLEHIEDDKTALTELGRGLQDDGCILISVPAIPSLYGIRDASIGHYRRYDLQRLTALSETAKLKLEHIQYWNMLGVIPYFFFERILHRPVNDELRKPVSSLTRKLANHILFRLLHLETHISNLPMGLSLLAIAKRYPQTSEG